MQQFKSDWGDFPKGTTHRNENWWQPFFSAEKNLKENPLFLCCGLADMILVFMLNMQNWF